MKTKVPWRKERLRCLIEIAFMFESPRTAGELERSLTPKSVGSSPVIRVIENGHRDASKQKKKVLNKLSRKKQKFVAQNRRMKTPTTVTIFRLFKFCWEKS